MRQKNLIILLTALLVFSVVAISTAEASQFHFQPTSTFQKHFPRPSPPKEPDPPPPSPGLSHEEQQMANLLNNERTSRGLRPLQVDADVSRVARLKSQDMVRNNYFSHYSPTYGYFSTMLRNAGISFRYAGENIAGASSVERAHNALMASSGHRANILRAGYTHVGVGIASGGPHGKIFTQLFIAR